MCQYFLREYKYREMVNVSRREIEPFASKMKE